MFIAVRSRPLSTLLMILTMSLSGLALGQGEDPPDIPRDQDLQDYRIQVGNLFPTFDSTMLNCPDGPDWFSPVSISLVSGAVGDSPPPSFFQDDWEVLARDSLLTKLVKISYDQGRIRWSNNDRQFDWVTSPHMPIGEPLAIQIATDVADALGIPLAERGPIEVTTIMGQHYGPEGASPAFSREQMVTIHRSINGHPVFGSLFRLSVSNLGEPSRLLVIWPQFVMPQGLALISEEDAVNAVSEQLWESYFGASLGIGIRLGYSRVGFQYLPIAMVSAEESEKGMNLIVPLVQTEPDSDLDGTPNATDNCPGTFNLHQRDRDGDGVGDRCDNCKATPNPAQLDLDEDGIGDACEAPEGGCELPSGDCETLTSEVCGILGGLYAGDGSPCPTPSDVPGLSPMHGLHLRADPNPFNATIEISVDLPGSNPASLHLDILDAKGRIIRTILSSATPVQGNQKVQWNGRDDYGRPVSSGVYLVRARTANVVEIEKIALIK